MSAAKNKTLYKCSKCNDTFIAWMGQCPSCKEWNTFTEISENSKQRVEKSSALRLSGLNSTDQSKFSRFSSGLDEVDRILGGGLVSGSVILLGGEPGIGKSTLLLALGKSKAKILYVSGEESAAQIIDRARRIRCVYPNVTLLEETSLAGIEQAIDEVKPEIVFVDSIQTVSSDTEKLLTGSVSQIRSATAALVQQARQKNIPIIMTGHITKEGQIAGPKVLEHAVDVVLYFESQNFGQYRFIRSVKNRYGATGEIAVFEMTEHGLKEVPREQSLIRLDEIGGIGSILFPQVDGTRVLPVEIQVLVTPASFSNGRRIGENIDISRIHMISAILEKFPGYQMSQSDIFVRVHGGTYLRDSAGDLALLLATASSYLNRKIPSRWAAAGELSLTGTVRAPSHLEERKKTLRALKIESAVWGGTEETTKIKLAKKELFFNDVKMCIDKMFAPQ